MEINHQHIAYGGEMKITNATTMQYAYVMRHTVNMFNQWLYMYLRQR